MKRLTVLASVHMCFTIFVISQPTTGVLTLGMPTTGVLTLGMPTTGVLTLGMATTGVLTLGMAASGPDNTNVTQETSPTLVSGCEQLCHRGADCLRGGAQHLSTALHRLSREREESALLCLLLGLGQISRECPHCVNVNLQRTTHFSSLEGEGE